MRKHILLVVLQLVFRAHSTFIAYVGIDDIHVSTLTDILKIEELKLAVLI